MTCPTCRDAAEGTADASIRSQVIAAAIATGRAPALARELWRQIDRLMDAPAREDVVDRMEHERVVGRLNARITDLNAQLEAAS